MAKKILVNLDLSKNQLLNAAIQNLSSAPSSPVAGQIYFNTSDLAVYFWSGTSWINVSGDISSVIAGAGLSGGGTGGDVNLDINVDNVTIEISGDSLQIKDLGITSSKIADGAVTSLKLASRAVSLSKIQAINSGTLLGRVSGGTGDVEEVSITQDVSINSPAMIPSASAVKTYVDTVVGSIGNLEGGWDAWSTGQFPAVGGSSANTKKGDYWYSTTAGAINTPSGLLRFEVGDVFIALVDGASQYNVNDWLVLQVNKDQATESTLGLVRIAPQNTVNAGTDNTEVVTPLTLKTLLDNRTGGYTTNVGNGSSTSFTVVHNLNTKDITVAIYDDIQGDEVIADVKLDGLNQIIVSFAVAPDAGQYRVVIKK